MDHSRVYFNNNTEEVIWDDDSYDMLGNGIYNYEESKNTLIDKLGKENHYREKVKYYKCWIKDIPYFKPIKKKGNLIICFEKP